MSGELTIQRQSLKDVLPYIISLYKSGKSLYEIANMFNASKEGVRRALLRAGLTLRTPAKAITKHLLNHSYFSTFSEQEAYDLGILLARGKIKHSGKHGWEILCDLHGSKARLLEDLRLRVRSSRPIYHHKNRNRVRLIVNSQQWVNDLQMLGFEDFQSGNKNKLLTMIDSKLHNSIMAGIKATELS